MESKAPAEVLACSSSLSFDRNQKQEFIKLNNFIIDNNIGMISMKCWGVDTFKISLSFFFFVNHDKPNK